MDEIDLAHTDTTPAYHRLQDEKAEHYELFTEWCRIPPSSRNLQNFCRRTSIPPRTAKKLHDAWRWEVRATLFDNDSMKLRPDPRLVDEEAAIAGQLAAATTLLDLGLSAIQLKNPALIPVDNAMKLVEKGVEVQRRALGQADLNVQFTVDDMSRVNRLLEDVVGLDDVDVFDAEVEFDDEAPTDA